ncbi:SidA/IucD/PvdA family monooxygenase [Bacillaceae bacterium SIJ1]|uniref:lysine N(6)-hydroxylase/L-ornithine N(5)-oxygenase family protein n=1 Tax=Litoribacterium kuwaitense TaxID=1398745 RepID=UPI0013EC4952|nr:SidA/IucD/PvdA family monooxygenase [Litoribacterium kuwaitense]NGP45464.1 SidA/IucD/PvdA family monooxygenase [Litoribacterium kuwaitense]
MNTEQTRYDMIGIGAGPYGLGLAAMCEQQGLTSLFFDRSNTLAWHPGMLIENANLQTSFLADLATFVDPTSPYTFLNYLKEQERLQAFFFYQRLDVPRAEYSRYLEWVGNQLQNVRLNHDVYDVKDHPSGDGYEVYVTNVATNEVSIFHTKHVALATGYQPNVPTDADLSLPGVFHSSAYVFARSVCERAERVAIIGSGQSAAEIFLDLLSSQQEYPHRELHWMTRSAGFMQMESAKLGQEVFSPDFVRYFHPLSYEKRQSLLPVLSPLRKGIDPETLRSIYNQLYEQTIATDPNISILARSSFRQMALLADGKKRLTFHHQDKEADFTIDADVVIFATGDKPRLPDWLFANYEEDIIFEDEARRQFAVGKNYHLSFAKPRTHHLYMLTNLEHSHGPAATNLGLAVYRNARIINDVLNKDVYTIPNKTVFQDFSP